MAARSGAEGSAARTRGPGAQHTARRAEIADAVLAVVAERGLAAVSLSTTAERAGVSPGRVQHYFPAKRALLEAAFDRGNARSAERIAARLGGAPDQALPRAALTTVLDELVPYDAGSDAHMRVRHAFNARALTDPAVAERVRGMYADFHARLAALIRRDQEAGRVSRALDPHATAVVLAAQAEGLAYYVLIGATDAATARARVRALPAELVYGERREADERG